MHPLSEAFTDNKFQKRVIKELPPIFEKAYNESKKFGKTGMEVGLIRKKNLIDFLVSYFGKDRVEIIFSQTLPDIDIKIDSQPVKIKTITGKSGVKIKWTVDKDKVENFLTNYAPSHGILLARFNRDTSEKNYLSGLSWIPLETQQKILNRIGIENYLKPPKSGTNSRGVEISKDAIKNLLKDKETKHIDIIR